MSENTTPTSETKETYIRIPTCVTRFANKTVSGVLPEAVTKRLPEQVNETTMKVAVPAMGVLGYLGYRLFRKFFGKRSEAPKAQ